MFEYKIIKFPALNNAELLKALNELGSKKWELVQIISTDYIFKRKIKWILNE